MRGINFESQNSKDISNLGFDFKDFSSKILKDKLRAIESFLTKVSTPSQSQTHVLGAAALETANSLVVEIFEELWGVSDTENTSELLRQG